VNVNVVVGETKRKRDSPSGHEAPAATTAETHAFVWDNKGKRTAAAACDSEGAECG